MRRRTGESGFTLIEMMVVMVIIGLCVALVGPNFIKQGEKAKLKAARAQIEMLGTSLDTFRLDVGRYPSTQEGLAALRQRPFGADRWDGPYIKKDVPADPWGRPYYYRSPGEGGRPAAGAGHRRHREQHPHHRLGPLGGAHRPRRHRGRARRPGLR